MNSIRATDFMAPKNATMALFREAVLDLAEHHPFARAFVNSGRLSVPDIYEDSPLSTPCYEGVSDGLPPGSPAMDAPITVDGRDTWLLDHFGGHFCLLDMNQGEAEHDDLGLHVFKIGRDFQDTKGMAEQRYGSGIYLMRPDQHVAARFARFDADAIRTAQLNALGGT